MDKSEITFGKPQVTGVGRFQRTRYDVIVDGEVVGQVEKFREASHRYVHSGRIIAGTSYPVRWRPVGPGHQTSYDTRKDAVRYGMGVHR